ncbi:hypothetical protein BO94DRAFT_599724 [Aspergillus sclerotioniger CBS 115572]|uniref:Kynurenine formamidase n=1 Tax=Aspergillus sclerotioniger CBS 115572 TaxID=1450535 RepID=A0A317WA05_9EURO|nr:hypothetical protein BO94DRAFT_599724 [Aspergillus sclerotioniger CBS 115572]PWY83203.1 hypothetical protein BO94DRAFT_599724 [Aspergillus sclerotioniger CBS 115572]
MSTETFQYGTDHDLQTVTVTTLNTTTTTTTGYWVILIHGGAWRDPTQTSTTYLHPTTTTFLNPHEPYPKTTTPYIHSIASISYRLSAHPSHPQDPTSTPPSHLRTATHPDHISDILSALSFLQSKYGFGENYLLVGHSCGATLAFQSVMGKFRTLSSGPAPVGILGMAGIYDLRLLRDTHRDVSAYQEFTEGAFGKDEVVWDGVSPAVVRGVDGVSGGWEGGRVVVLAYSAEDGLVDAGQREVMRRALGEVEGLDIRGQHDDAWMEGRELARGIEFAIGLLREGSE